MTFLETMSRAVAAHRLAQMGYREEASYLGIWVPGIFSAGTFIRFSLTRAKRK